LGGGAAGGAGGANGTANTGGGGSGQSHSHANASNAGGSGIVIIRTSSLGVNPAFLVDAAVGNPGTMHNGNCFDFDGTDDYITINGFASKDPGDDSAWAITFWARGDTTSAGTNNDMIFSGHTTSGGNIIRIGYDRTNGGIFYSDDNTSDVYAGTTKYNDNVWHHVVITRPSGSGNQTTDIYVDGTKVTGGTFSTTDPTWSSATQFSIGQEWDSATPGDYFAGDLADIRVYDVL